MVNGGGPPRKKKKPRSPAARKVTIPAKYKNIRNYAYHDESFDRQMITRAETGENRSLFPSWHCMHICGIFCDGQDGGGSQCAWEKQAGPPEWYKQRSSVVDHIELTKDRGIISEKHPVKLISGADVTVAIGPGLEKPTLTLGLEKSALNVKESRKMDLIVNDSIDGFVIKEIIHTGDWGNVYKVQPRGINQTYALKMATSEDSQSRLYTEREILDKIGGHENITKIYFGGNDPDSGEYDSGDGFFYIVEEYASSNLREKLDTWSKNSGREMFPSFACTVSILKQILQGLKFAHGKGIIHQDLKPGNILLSPNGATWKVQLCDFGLAYSPDSDSLESSLDDAKTVAGSLHYLSPEQRTGKKIDKRTDLYNVGLIFYEMLTYKRPTISLVTPTEVRKKLQANYSHYQSSRPKDLPKWVDSFVLKALAADPADRFKNADEMLETIEKAMAPPAKAKPTYVAPEPEPGFLARAKNKVVAGCSKMGKGLWWLTKMTAFLPIAVVFAPFVFCAWALSTRFVSRENAELPVVLITALWAAAWYIALMPYCFELNVRHQLIQNTPAGTILYYHASDTESEPQGFYFVRGDKLPETSNFDIRTPEIGSSTGSNGSYFAPKHALSADGTIFYYTTPDSLVRIRLDLPKTSPDFRKVVVRSEVFSYFSVLNFVDGPQGLGLYAKLKNETWFITKDGLLQQTHNSITITNYNKRVNGNYYADGNTVEFNSNLIGNINIGPASHGEAVWYPQTLSPKFGWSD
jgi:serine/threonine protein kinase